MLVSGFHLEYAKGSSQAPAYVSGYELELTNLADREIRFDVLARVTRHAFTVGSPPESPGRVLADLKELIRGVMRNDQLSWFEGGWGRDADGFALRLAIPVAPGSSELVKIVPDLYQSRTWWPRIAGYVELTVPALRSPDPPHEWVMQSPRPVAVLLNPSTVERWEVPGAGGGGAFANSRTSPPLASGRAYNDIDPGTDPGLVVTDD